MSRLPKKWTDEWRKIYGRDYMKKYRLKKRMIRERMKEFIEKKKEHMQIQKRVTSRKPKVSQPNFSLRSGNNLWEDLTKQDKEWYEQRGLIEKK